MLLIVAAAGARRGDPDGGEVPRLLTGRIEGLRRGEDHPRVLGGGHRDVAGVPGSVPRTVDGVRAQRAAGLDEGVDLAEHAREADAHRRSPLRPAPRRDEEHVLERPPAQVHELAGDAEQLEEPEPADPEVDRRRQVGGGDRHERRHPVDAAERLRRNRVRAGNGYRAHLERVVAVAHAPTLEPHAA
jgi:hypothetical protein